MADGRAVGAAHVIGEDFQLRLGVYLGVGGQQQSLVGLLGVGLLRVGPDEDFAVEDAARVTVNDAFVDLMAVAMGHGVVNSRVVVHQLPAIGKINTIESAFPAFPAEDGVGVVADQPPAQADGVRREVAAPGQLHLHRGDVKRRQAFPLHFVVV